MILPTQHTEHLYDTANRLASQRWEIDGKSFSESFRYNDPADTGTPLGDGSLYQFTAATGSRLTYSYDGLKRLSTVSVASSLGNPLFYTGRNYADGAETDQTTNRISVTSYRKTNGTLIAGTGFLYEYDAAGNLSRVREMVTDSTYRTLAEYSYDSQNQLSYEVRYSYVGNNLTGPLTSLHYFYDTAGNLLKVEENEVEIETYAYGNEKWRDLLTAYNGHTILYEGQTGSNTAPLSGNPITWYNGSGTEFTALYWEQGRRLRSMQYQDAANQYQADFRYDMDGIRTEKNVDGRLHKYVTQSGKVVRETVCDGSTLQYTLDFVYDAGGQPFALIRTMPDNTKTTYYYVLNAQGDVVKLINASGTTYATYRYDAWGRVLSATGTLAEVNPLRYRGYYYDTETDWYYLQSRYYDPIVKRFINADSYGSTGTSFLGYNMFAYCNCNPMEYCDESGHSILASTYVCSDAVGFDYSGRTNASFINYSIPAKYNDSVFARDEDDPTILEDLFNFTWAVISSFQINIGAGVGCCSGGSILGADIEAGGYFNIAEVSIRIDDISFSPTYFAGIKASYLVYDLASFGVGGNWIDETYSAQPIICKEKNKPAILGLNAYVGIGGSIEVSFNIEHFNSFFSR